MRLMLQFCLVFNRRIYTYHVENGTQPLKIHATYNNIAHETLCYSAKGFLFFIRWVNYNIVPAIKEKNTHRQRTLWPTIQCCARCNVDSLLPILTLLIMSKWWPSAEFELVSSFVSQNNISWALLSLSNCKLNCIINLMRFNFASNHAID